MNNIELVQWPKKVTRLASVIIVNLYSVLGRNQVFEKQAIPFCEMLLLYSKVIRQMTVVD